MIALQGLNVGACGVMNREITKHDRVGAGNPLWNHYECADGKWLAFAMLWSDRCWPDFCRIIGIQNLQNNPKFSSIAARRENSEELISILDNILITRPRDEWIKIIDNEKQYIVPAKAIAVTVIDLLYDDAERAKQVIENFTPTIKREEYTEFMKKFVQ